MILILTSSSEKARLSEDGRVFSTRFPAEDLSFYFLLLISQPALLLRHAVRLTVHHHYRGQLRSSRGESFVCIFFILLNSVIITLIVFSYPIYSRNSSGCGCLCNCWSPNLRVGEARCWCWWWWRMVSVCLVV